MQFLTTVYTDDSIFTDLKDEWLDLLSRSVTNYVFQTPQFQEAWWTTLGTGELRIIAVRTGEGKLVGLAPLFLDSERQLCFVGCVNVSDYLDFLIDQQHQTDVYAAIGGVLKSDSITWKSLYLCSLPEVSPTRQWLKDSFATATETQQDVSPQIALPANWEAYLESIDRKQRHEIKRKMRRVNETEHAYELFTTETEAHTAIDEFIKLHQASSAEKKDFWDESHLKFFKQFVPAAGRAGWLKLYFLKIDDIRAAAMLIFDYNNQYLLYNSGFDPLQFRNLSTGNVLTAYTIQQAIDANKSLYDFLRGDEEYKFRFGAVAKPVFDISINT